MTERPVPSFEEYLRQRGFDVRARGAFVRRMCVTAWGEPGFHRFWRLWNPLYGYALFRLYVALGGARRPLVASFVVFVACGFFLHDLWLVPTGAKLGFNTTLAFAVFWALASLSRVLAPRLEQETWDRRVNALVNAGCIGVGLTAGAALGSFLSRWL
jgi:hypothetical protein